MSGFKLGGPVGHPYVTVPRPEQATLENCLESLDYAAVLGQRGCGKTTIQLAVKEQLRSKGFRVARVDLAAVGIDQESTFDDVATAILEGARRDLGVYAQQRVSDLPLYDLIDMLVDLTPSQQSPVIIMIDEYESPNNRVIGALLQSLRGLKERAATTAGDPHRVLRWVAVSIAGVGSPFDYQNVVAASMFAPVEVHIGGFPQTEETVRTLAQGFDTKRSRVAQATVREILNWTAGDPSPTMDLLLRVEAGGLPSRMYETETAIRRHVKNMVEEFRRLENAPSWLLARQAFVIDNRDAESMVEIYAQMAERGRLRNFRPVTGAQRRFAESGLVAWSGNDLVIRSRLSGALFGPEWVKGALKALGGASIS